MWNIIRNPITNRNVNLDSVLGKKILNEYIKQLKGGAINKSENVDMKNCSEKKKTKIGEGSYKKIWTINCNPEYWNNETLDFNDNFSAEKCDESIIAITNDENFKNEVKIKDILDEPGFYRWGDCLDTSYKYLIEQKKDMDLKQSPQR